MRHLQEISIALFFALAVSWTPCRLVGDEPKNPQADSTAHFTREVFPVLQRHCLECHGDKKQEANLRLDGHKNLVDSGLIDPNNSDASELIRRIQLPAGHAELMPATGYRLKEKEIYILRQWVANGATWPTSFEAPKHWAYQQPVKAELAVSEGNSWIRTPIDSFVLQRIKAAGMSPSPAAEPNQFIRRLYFDLIGLPPTPDEVAAFVHDPSDDHFQRIVNDLLQRPQFGEKWARHWLDLARYADSHGFQRDDLRDNWAWRDWVIQALNDDMPFDQFTIEQIAGDLLPNATESQKIATGFHRSAPTNVEAGSIPEETRAEQLIDRVNTTSTVWLGTTMECVQCHDHKYDPFTTRDYYGLLAFFNNTAIEADRTNPKQPSSIAFQGPTMPLSNDERDRERTPLTEQLSKLETALQRRRSQLGATLVEWTANLATQTESSPVLHPLEVTEFRSQGNTDSHEHQPDGSILLIGNDPPSKDVYTLKAAPVLKGVQAFRLDALTHDSLPGRGPGRGDPKKTNFVLHEFSVSVFRKDDPKPQSLKFESATADFSQDRWDVSGAIDGDDATGWASAPQFSQTHWANFVLEEPLDLSEGDTLSIELHQNFGNAGTLGCFRISAVTGNSGATPEPTVLSESLLKIARQTPTEWSDSDRKTILDFRVTSDNAAKRIEKQIASIKKQLTKWTPETTLVMVEQETRPAYIFERGDYRQHGPAVEPSTPAVLHPMPSGPTNRLTLARWLVDPANPLVARVTINRWWAEIFGTGLVSTPEDFGIKGERPTHPELLDWLAVDFIENGWSMKHVLRTIVTSSTYRQSSFMSTQLKELDDQNRLLARGPRFRLDAETIRDNALSVSGLIDLTQSGPPIRPVQPEGLWAKVGGQQYDYVVSEGTQKYRRSIYIVHKRSAPNPTLMTFDGSARLACTVKRSRTNTPLQSLALMNDPVFVDAARALAHRIISESSDREPATRIARGFELCTSRKPTERELLSLITLFHDQVQELQQRPDDVKLLTQATPDSIKATKPEIAAWYSVATVLLNLHETITKP